MRAIFTLLLCCCISIRGYSWGFYAHRLINQHAVFLLPPEMMVLYKPSIDFLRIHAVDPDKRRYAVAEEAARHFIDLDHYHNIPRDSLRRPWPEVTKNFSVDSLQAHGIVPWWIQTMLFRLTEAFKAKDQVRILKLSAEIGHYISDAHVPLHACSNYNGQLTGQHGIHGFWESRIPELLAEKEWDFFIGTAEYINHPLSFTWDRVQESAAAADTVLLFERRLKQTFPADQQFAFELRNGIMVRQYSLAYSLSYNSMLNSMIERRMRQSIYAVASFWYTAWVNAGQPDLKNLVNKDFSEEDLKAFELMDKHWREANRTGCEK